MNHVNGSEIPLGFGMTLAQNAAAMQKFSEMTQELQQEFIAKAQKVRTKKEMQALVNSLDAN